MTGTTGATGNTGIQGLIGLTGATGNTGIQGPIGLTGATGNTGIQGSIGLTGATGNTGIQGLIGATGTTGNTGIQGLTGATGASLLPNNSAATVIAQPGGTNSSFFPTGAIASTNLITGTAVTAPSNGIAYIQVGPLSQSTSTPITWVVYVNGTRVMQATSVGGNNMWQSFTVPMRAGDTVQLAAYNPGVLSTTINSYVTSSAITFAPLTAS